MSSPGSRKVSSGARKAMRLIAAVGVALFGFLWLATPAAAQVSTQPAAADYFAMSAGRLGSIVAGLLGLTGAVIAGIALARPTSRIGIENGPGGGYIALVTGLIAMVLGGLVVATSEGGIGTGNGRAGAYIALVVGLLAMLLGGLALTRSRRTG